MPNRKLFLSIVFLILVIPFCLNCLSKPLPEDTGLSADDGANSVSVKLKTQATNQLNRLLINDAVILRLIEAQRYDEAQKQLEKREIENCYLYIVELGDDQPNYTLHAGLRAAAKYFSGKEIVYDENPEVAERVKTVLKSVEQKIKIERYTPTIEKTVPTK